jgi:hypothetical protein
VSLLLLLQPPAAEPPPEPPAPAGAGVVTATAGTPFEATASVTSAAVTLPAGLVAGDYTILIASANGTTPVITPPAGWVALFPSTQSTASTSHAAAVYYRRWVTGDPDPTVTTTSARLAVLPVRVQGADPATFLDTAVASTSGAASTAITAPGQTPATTGQLFMVAAGRLGSSGTVLTLTAPPGMTEVGEADSRSTTQSNASAALYVEAVTIGADTGTRTATASSSSTGSRGISFVLKGAPTAVPDPIDTLVDDFTTQDTSKWTGWATGSVEVINGRLRITPEGAYPALTTTARYNLTGSAVAVQLATPPNIGNGSTEAALQLTVDADNSLELLWSAGNLVSRYKSFGVADDTFAGTAGRSGLRIREAGGTVYWDASPDGVTWDTLRTLTGLDFPVDSVNVALRSGFYGAETAPGVAEFDYLNTAAPVVDPRPTGVYFDYRADDAIATYATATTGTAVIPDTSGNTRPGLVFAASAQRPTLNTGGANGHNYLSFDGVDDRLTTSNATDPSMLTFLNGKPGGTVAAVVRLPNGVAATTRYIAHFSTTTAAARMGIYADSNSTWAVQGRRLDADTTQGTNSILTVDTNLHLLVGVNDYTDATQRLYLDGQLIGERATFQTAGSTSATNALTFNVGSNATPSLFFNGELYELLGYDRALTPAEVDQLWTYGSDRYALTGAPAPAAGAATYSGAGGLSFGGAPTTTAAATYTGTGTLTTTGTAHLTAAGTLNLTGTGTLTTSGTPRPAGAATYTGDGALTATGVPTQVGAGTAAYTGTGQLTTTGTPRPTAPLGFTGAGILTFTGTPRPSGAAGFTGTGALTFTTSPRPVAVATYTGTGAFTTTGTATPSAALTLTGDGTLTHTGTPRTAGTLTLTGDGTLTTTGTGTQANAGGATYTGTGTLTASPNAVTVAGTAAFTGAGSLTHTAAPRTTGTATYAGTGTYTPGGIGAAPGTASYAGSGALTFTTTPRATGAAAFTGTGALTYTALTRVSGTATYTGAGAFTTGGFSGRGGNLTLTGTGQLQLTGAPRGAGTAAYTGAGTLVSGGAAKATGVATYTGTGGLSFTGLRPAITSTITGVGHLSMSAALFVDEPTTPTARDITVTVTGPVAARRHVTGPAGTHLHVTGPTPAPVAVLGSTA